MAVKLTHLQLIYGVAGAREKFEDLVIHLIRSERPDTERVRIVRGDGGIDAHAGSLADLVGVDIFQIKFFPDGVGDSQKAQIRDSFRTAAESDKFKMRSWTLCLPIDLSTDEKLWFDGWKAKQSGVIIQPVWDALKLEGLLYNPNNRHLKEEFFKEEYLQQIRDSHALLLQLIQELDERFPRPVPLVLDTRLYPPEPGKAHVLDDQLAVIEVVVPVNVYNNNRQSVASWNVKAEFCVVELQRFVTRTEFPQLSPGRLNLFNMTILPTMHKETDLVIGLKSGGTTRLSRNFARACGSFRSTTT